MVCEFVKLYKSAKCTRFHSNIFVLTPKSLRFRKFFIFLKIISIDISKKTTLVKIIVFFLTKKLKYYDYNF